MPYINGKWYAPTVVAPSGLSREDKKKFEKLSRQERYSDAKRNQQREYASFKAGRSNSVRNVNWGNSHRDAFDHRGNPRR